MFDLQNIRITSILPIRDSILACCSYHNWSSELNFIVEPGGIVRGRSNQGYWLELSPEMGSLVCRKIKSILSQR